VISDEDSDVSDTAAKKKKKRRAKPKYVAPSLPDWTREPIRKKASRGQLESSRGGSSSSQTAEIMCVAHPQASAEQ